MKTSHIKLPSGEGGIGPAPGHFGALERQAWDDIVRAVPPRILIGRDRLCLDITAQHLALFRQIMRAFASAPVRYLEVEKMRRSLAQMLADEFLIPAHAIEGLLRPKHTA
jgi:hypothetical protein